MNRIIKIVLLFQLPLCLCGQSIDTIYSEILDSNSYIKNLRSVGATILLEKGTLVPDKGRYCGNHGQRYVEDSDIYKLNNSGIFPLISGHLDKSNNQILIGVDSTLLLSKYEYFDVTDSSGVFLPRSSTDHYWKYFNRKIELEQFGQDTLLSSYYPFWFHNKLIIYLRDSRLSSQMFFIDSTSLKLHQFIKSTYDFRVHNPTVYDSLLIFNTYNPETKDSRLYGSDVDGNIQRLTYFDTALFHLKREIQIDSLLYIRVQDRGIPDNYDNEHFKPTEFYTLNLRSKELEQISKMPIYGITYGAINISGNFATLFGYKEYQFISPGSETNMIQEAKQINHYLAKTAYCNNNLITIAMDTNSHHRFAIIDSKTGKLNISQKVDEVIGVKCLEQSCYTLHQNENGDQILNSLGMKGEVSIINGLEPFEVIRLFEVFTLNGSDYLLIGNSKNSNLYRINKTDNPTLLVSNISNIRYDGLKKRSGNSNFLVTSQSIYCITNSKDKNQETHIIKIE